MKSNIVLWFLLVASICLLHGQNQIANSENSYGMERPTSKGASPKRAGSIDRNTPFAALFSGAEASPALASGAGLDDGVLAAYMANRGGQRPDTFESAKSSSAQRESRPSRTRALPFSIFRSRASRHRFRAK
jgi:hypothetical protein